MARSSAGGDQILVKPTNNVYTVLAAVGIIAGIVAIVYIIMMHKQMYPNTDFFGPA